VSDDQLIQARDEVLKQYSKAPSWMIADHIKSNMGVEIDASTIRGRLLKIAAAKATVVVGPSPEELRAGLIKSIQTPAVVAVEKGDTIEFKPAATVSHDVDESLKDYIPQDSEFEAYIERPIDRRLAVHYDCGITSGIYKYPITQGKQGTGKTFGHAYYAWTRKLPFFLFSCYEDFKLPKMFGDKTIINGTVKYQESLFVKAIQSPSVILFDEINAISNSNSFDFHALLQNRELFIKDADDGKGKTYKLHPQCRIGFAQNPKSAKYIGGNIKPSNFLGRCTFITYPEFTKDELVVAMKKKFKALKDAAVKEFVTYYLASLKLIDNAKIPIDISIRQLANVIDLWSNGLSLNDAIEDGMASMTEAASQPQAKDSFKKLAEATFKELAPKEGGN
jgi:hypothetical protein